MTDGADTFRRAQQAEPISLSPEPKATRRPKQPGPWKTLVANRPLTQLLVAFAFVSTAEWADVTALSVHALRRYRLVETPLAPRVTGIIESTKLALEGLGGFLAPVLVLLIGIRGVLWVAAAPLPLVAVTGWRMLHRMDANAGERAQLLELVHGVHWLHSLDVPSLENRWAAWHPCSSPRPGPIWCTRATKAICSTSWSRGAPTCWSTATSWGR